MSQDHVNKILELLQTMTGQVPALNQEILAMGQIQALVSLGVVLSLAVTLLLLGRSLYERASRPGGDRECLHGVAIIVWITAALFVLGSLLPLQDFLKARYFPHLYLVQETARLVRGK